MAEVGSSLPFIEQRHVVTSVDVSLTASYISSLPLQANENLLSWPLPGFEPGAAVKIHIRMRASAYFFIEVHVEGLPEDSGVWLKGDFQWRVRNYGERDCLRTIPPLPSPITWLRGNGCLGFFIFSHTIEISGKVTVYGAVEDPDSLTGLLVPDLRSLRHLTALCDVVLRAAGKDFPAHKVVLASRSPVMLTMFTANFKEATDKVVDIAVDCSADVFGAFVDYLYSGVMDKRRTSCGDLLHMLELAERHLVADLKAQCVKQLCRVGVDEALQVLEASLEKPFVPKECREHAFRLIRKNWETVSVSDEWVKFCTTHIEFALAVECMMMDV